MNYFYYLFNIFTGKYKYRIFDFYVNEDNKIVFIVSTISHFIPKPILLEDLAHDNQMLRKLDPNSSRLFHDLYGKIQHELANLKL